MKSHRYTHTLGLLMAMVGIALLGAQRVHGQQVQLKVMEKKPVVQDLKKVEQPKVSVKKPSSPTVKMKTPAKKTVSIKKVSKQKFTSNKKISKPKKVTDTTHLKTVTNPKQLQKIKAKKLPANVNLKVQPHIRPLIHHPPYNVNLRPRTLPGLNSRGVNQSNMQTHSLDMNRGGPDGDSDTDNGKRKGKPSKGKKTHPSDDGGEEAAAEPLPTAEGVLDGEIVDKDLYRNPHFRKLMTATISTPLTESIGPQLWRSPFWVSKLNEFLLKPPPVIATKKNAQEYWYWQVKNDPKWIVDVDEDGLTALAEKVFKTDPLNPDSNGNGRSDLEDALAGVDPKRVITQPMVTPEIPNPGDDSPAGSPVQVSRDSMMSQPNSRPDALSAGNPGPGQTDSGSDASPADLDEPLHSSGAGEGR